MLDETELEHQKIVSPLLYVSPIPNQWHETGLGCQTTVSPLLYASPITYQRHETASRIYAMFAFVSFDTLTREDFQLIAFHQYQSALELHS